MIEANQSQTTYGHKREPWEAAKAEVIRLLRARAKQQDWRIFYSDLCRQISAIKFDPHGHDFHGLLGQVSVESDAAGQGMVSALVIHKEGDQRPGDGFFSLAQDLGRDVSDRDKCWLHEVERVRSFS